MRHSHNAGRARLVALVLAAFAACRHGGDLAIDTPAAPPTLAERMLALLPDGAQVVVELDLARLRANATVGPLARSALAQMGSASPLPGLPLVVAGSPLGAADAVVLAAYGVGTANAAAVTILATKATVPGGVQLAPDLVAVGPEEWTSQLAARAAVAAQHPLAIPDELKRLRVHAEPEGATGAVVRLTARLPFDARIALARMTGLDEAPARVSLWADVADDVAIVVDADARDPGDPPEKSGAAAKRLAHSIRGFIAELDELPAIRALGVTASLDDARLISQGTWVRTVVAVGPRHLARVLERARAMLAAP